MPIDVKTKTTKQLYPDKSIEELNAMVEQMNAQVLAEVEIQEDDEPVDGDEQA